MPKQRSNISKLLSILLIIVALLSVSQVRNYTQSNKSAKKNLASDHHAPVKSNEVLLKNVAIEAVMPFMQLVLLHHFVTSTFVFFPSYTISYGTQTFPGYINKYLKNLFLFIISPNAP